MKRVYHVLSVFGICLFSVPSYAMKEAAGLDPQVELLAFGCGLAWSLLDYGAPLICLPLFLPSYTCPACLHFGKTRTGGLDTPIRNVPRTGESFSRLCSSWLDRLDAPGFGTYLGL
jgi:hypothetical protein